MSFRARRRPAALQAAFLSGSNAGGASAARSGGTNPRRLVRLNKRLRDLGLCSRREADAFIRAGRVTVNGAAATQLGLLVDPAADAVALHASAAAEQGRRLTIALHKPRSFISQVCTCMCI